MWYPSKLCSEYLLFVRKNGIGEHDPYAQMANAYIGLYKALVKIRSQVTLDSTKETIESIKSKAKWALINAGEGKQ